MKTKTLIAVTALAGCAFVHGHAQAASLVALWEFEETAGKTALDSVASLELGMLNSVDLNVAGRFGSGADFSPDSGGTSGGLATSTASKTATMPTGDFSIALWIKPTAADLTNDFNRFIDTSSNDGGITSGYRLFTGSTSDRFRFLARSGLSNTDINHTRDLLADTWTLLVVRYDTDGQATANVLFDTDAVNAAFVASNGQSASANGPITYDSIEDTNFAAQDSANAANEYDGLMDDAAFFSGLLTDEEVATIFNSGAATFVPEPTSLALLGLGTLALARRRRG